MARNAPWREVNENDFIVLISKRLPYYLIVKRRQERKRVSEKGIGEARE